MLRKIKIWMFLMLFIPVVFSLENISFSLDYTLVGTKLNYGDIYFAKKGEMINGKVSVTIDTNTTEGEIEIVARVFEKSGDSWNLIAERSWHFYQLDGDQKEYLLKNLFVANDKEYKVTFYSRLIYPIMTPWEKHSNYIYPTKEGDLVINKHGDKVVVENNSDSIIYLEEVLLPGGVVYSYPYELLPGKEGEITYKGKGNLKVIYKIGEEIREKEVYLSEEDYNNGEDITVMAERETVIGRKGEIKEVYVKLINLSSREAIFTKTSNSTGMYLAMKLPIVIKSYEEKEVLFSVLVDGKEKTLWLLGNTSVLVKIKTIVKEEYSFSPVYEECSALEITSPALDVIPFKKTQFSAYFYSNEDVLIEKIEKKNILEMTRFRILSYPTILHAGEEKKAFFEVEALGEGREVQVLDVFYYLGGKLCKQSFSIYINSKKDNASCEGIKVESKKVFVDEGENILIPVENHSGEIFYVDDIVAYDESSLFNVEIIDKPAFVLPGDSKSIALKISALEGGKGYFKIKVRGHFPSKTCGFEDIENGIVEVELKKIKEEDYYIGLKEEYKGIAKRWKEITFEVYNPTRKEIKLEFYNEELEIEPREIEILPGERRYFTVKVLGKEDGSYDLVVRKYINGKRVDGKIIHLLLEKVPLVKVEIKKKDGKIKVGLRNLGDLEEEVKIVLDGKEIKTVYLPPRGDKELYFDGEEIEVFAEGKRVFRAFRDVSLEDLKVEWIDSSTAKVSFTLDRQKEGEIVFLDKDGEEIARERFYGKRVEKVVKKEGLKNKAKRVVIVVNGNKIAEEDLMKEKESLLGFVLLGNIPLIGLLIAIGLLVAYVAWKEGRTKVKIAKF